MSVTRNEGERIGVTASDCARLWSTLTTEYIPGLRIEVRILESATGQVYLSVEVVDDSLESLNGSPLVNIWASREYVNPLYLISRDQLFDLLIVAYRTLDGYFTNGTPSAPTRRPK
jgi:hypothetical protein